MTLRRSDVCAWLLASSILAASPLLAQSGKTTKPLTPEQQAAREKFDPNAQTSTFGGSVVEDVVARVNDQIISRSDYDRAAAQLEQEGHQQGWTEQELADHKKDMLRDLVDQQLLLSKGKDLGITGETELVRRLDDIRKQNHLDSMEDLEKAATQQGVSYEDFKQNIRNGIITQQVIRDEVGRHLQMTNTELQRYYQQHQSDFSQPESVRLSEILVPVGTGGDEAADLAAAKSKADDLEAKLKGGTSFEDLSKANSAGSTAAQGGDLGEFKRGSLAKQLEDATFSLQAGQYTAPIRTKQGYVLLKVTQHTAGGTQDFAAMRPQVEEAAFMSRMQPALRTYLAQLRQNAYVDVRPGYVDTAAAPNSVKPLYSAYTPPAPKKKVHFKRTRYTGAHRGFRNKSGTATDTAAGTTNGAAAGAAGNAATATGAADSTKATPAGSTTAVATSKAKPTVEKPGKKEKVRFGQAPREALPPAAEPANGEQAAGAAAGAGTTGAGTPATGSFGTGTAGAGATGAATGEGNDQQVASNGNSTSDIPEGVAPPAEDRKTRFSDRARLPKAKKVKTPDQVENERVDQATPDEAAAQKTQSAPLGLAGDTATKKKAPKVTGNKTRYSNEANKPKEAPAPPPQSSTPVTSGHAGHSAQCRGPRAPESAPQTAPGGASPNGASGGTPDGSPAQPAPATPPASQPAPPTGGPATTVSQGTLLPAPAQGLLPRQCGEV